MGRGRPRYPELTGISTHVLWAGQQNGMAAKAEARLREIAAPRERKTYRSEDRSFNSQS